MNAALLFPSTKRSLGGDLDIEVGSVMVAEALGACDCFGDVRDDSLAPAPDLIAEDAEAGKASTSDRTFDRDPPRRAIGVRDGPRVLDHEAPFRHPYLERCVVEVERSPALAACAD